MRYHSTLWSLDNWGKLHMERLKYKDIWDETRVKLSLTTALHRRNKLFCNVDKMQREKPAKLMVKNVDQLQQQEAWANSTAAWQLNGVINSLNLYVGHLSTDIFLVCCLFHDAVSLSGYIPSKVGSLEIGEFGFMWKTWKENHDEPQNSWCSGRDLNWVPPER